MSYLLTAIYMLDFLLALAGVLLSVAFFTLVERKVMGLMHYRKGPNKVLVFGVTQPIADAAKLLTKESVKMTMTKNLMFMTGPFISLMTMLICWTMFSCNYELISGAIKFLVIFSTMGLSIYGLIAMGWGSNSKYALLGAHRAIAQVISYEVCLFLFVLAMAYVSMTYSMSSLKLTQQGLWLSFAMAPLFLTWVLLCLAESNRTPFDSAEGESEIVSGFNIEYGGGLFALIFISEYGMIMFLSFLTSILFLGGASNLMFIFLMSMVFVWARCSFPRVRYDKLMALAWKIALPYSLVTVSFSLTI